MLTLAELGAGTAIRAELEALEVALSKWVVGTGLTVVAAGLLPWSASCGESDRVPAAPPRGASLQE